MNVAVLCASGSLGVTPIHPTSYWAAVDTNPNAIVADGGSGDIGPAFLGSGEIYGSRQWVKHDLRLMLLGARRLGVPMIVGSCGGAGTDAGVDHYFEVLQEIAREESLSGFTVATIRSELDLNDLARRARSQRVRGLGLPDNLTPEDVESCSRAVAMMGVEPLLQALDRGADVILAGRACDDALFAAVPIRAGCDVGLSWHMGKTIECGPLVATPVIAREAIVGTVRDTDFLVEPFHPDQRCTPASVSGHTLYERLDPFEMLLPGGQVDLHNVTFEAHSDRVCRVAGAAWIPSSEYTVKVEGSAFEGHRAYFLFGLRDPGSIANVDAICSAITTEVEAAMGPVNNGARHLLFHVYGRDAIMGPREPTPTIRGHEIAIVVEAVAPQLEVAVEMAKLSSYMSLRAYYPGKPSTAGGAAMMGDEVLRGSTAYKWTIDHLLPLADPCELFPIQLAQL